MPSLTLADKLIWFAHCPKAGGTSVEQALVARFGPAVGHLYWGWDLWWRGGGWRIADPPNSPQHLIWRDAVAALPRSPDAVFAVVRDPAARMASEHRWQRGGRRGTWAGKALARLPFSFWLRLMLAVARWNPYAFDNHFRSQSAFVPEGAVVFRLENGLAPVLDWLDEVAGGADGAGIPHVLSSGTGAGLRPSDAALIARVFAEDYRRFAYPAPHRPSARPDPLLWLAALLAPPVALLDRLGRL